MRKVLLILPILISTKSFCQTEIDGLMMDKNYFCVGLTAGKSSWKNYWEGTLKRDNLNLGTVSSTNITVNGNYGIANNLGLIFTLPYIKTNASAGQLAGQKGIQDLSVYLKWVGLTKQFKKSILSGILVGGASVPFGTYTPDLLPLSIGTQSKTLSLRAMVDFQQGNWFGTASGTYIYRGNVTLDRYSYYTTSLQYSNKVHMPDASNINLRAGYRSEVWIIEAIANQWITNGGFDITRNNMPFVRNRMNATTIGLHVKYETSFLDGLSFIGDGVSTIAGRNVGQSSGFTLGAFYIMDFSKKQKNTSPVPNSAN